MIIQKQSSIFEPNSLNDFNIFDWFDLIKSSKYSILIQSYRRGVIDKKKLFNSLPCANYNFYFNNSKENANICRSTGLIFIDIDCETFAPQDLLKSKIFALYRSISNRWHIIVKVSGVNEENFKTTYLSICKDLNLLDYIDKNAIKPTQSTFLSYDPDIYINQECKIYKANTKAVENNIKKIHSSIISNNINNKNTCIEELCKKLKTTNADEVFNVIGSKENYKVDMNGREVVTCFLPKYKIKNGQRNRVLLSYTINLVYINPSATIGQVYRYIEAINLSRLVEPLPASELKTIVLHAFKLKKNGTLNPIIYRKKRKIVFNPSAKITKEEKMNIVRSELALNKVKKTRERITNIINDWNFEESGKITMKKITELHKFNRITLAKYWKEFKAIVKEKNEDHKLKTTKKQNTLKIKQKHFCIS